MIKNKDELTMQARGEVRHGQGKVKLTSRQGQEKVKTRSGHGQGKVKERFRQGKIKVKERSRGKFNNSNSFNEFQINFYQPQLTPYEQLQQKEPQQQH